MSKKRPLKAFITHLHEHTSLTIKVVIVTIIIGLTLWALLDYVQSSRLKKIFYVQLVEKLTEQAMSDRLNFDRYIKSFHESVKLFITQRNLTDYVEKQAWLTEDIIQIKYYKAPPPWLPKHAVLRLFARPRYAILLDSKGMVREVYQMRPDAPPPPSLLQPSPLMLIKSHEQSFITSVDDFPFLIASESYSDTQGKLLATLMLISPIDDEFLTVSVKTFTQGHLVALVTAEEVPHILTSSNVKELASGTPLHALKDRYLVTGQQTYDYGAAEYVIKLASFISMKEVDKLIKSVITTGRYQRNVIAPVFILTFTFIMLWVSQRINRLKNRMSDFSQQTLGVQKEELQKGDQLFVLEKRFQRLTEEVVEAREKLKIQAEEQTRLIVSNAFDAIIAMDANGVITTWNPQAEAIFGWTREEAVGLKAADTIVSPSYRETIEESIKKFLASGEGLIFNMQIEITALHRDGHEFPVEMTASPARSGNSYVFIAIIRDITERKRAEDELTRHRMHLRELVKEKTAELTRTNEQLQKEIAEHKISEKRKAELLKELESTNRELKDFAYIVSHDLKAPLRAISTLANWISTDYDEKLDEEGKEQLGLLIRRVHRMNALINGILDYSRVGRIKEEKKEVNVNELVAEVIDMVAPPENIKITIENELPLILFEKTRLVEIFQNLLSNAVKYMNKPQGSIKIGCVEDNGYWKFSVSDNGPGIEEKFFNKIFQIFQTLSPLDEHESTGIGLTLVKKIITMYGGNIWVESEVGRCCTFFFTLPKRIKPNNADIAQ
jgi:PAS domain S-box-containing protein